MTRLDVLSSLVMDALNQQYSKDSDFFKIDDFSSYCAVFYFQVLQEEFNKRRREYMQSPNLENEEVTLSDAWYKIKSFTVQKEGEEYSITMPTYLLLSNDTFNVGIRQLFVNGNKSDCCNNFAKIKMSQCNSLQFLPKSDRTVYYYPFSDKIVFKNAKCKLEGVSLDVMYIPSLSEEADELNETIIPSGVCAEIVTRTYNFLIQAKNGNVVDKTNNQNPNKGIQTEIQES